jgi:hypothetical protein
VKCISLCSVRRLRASRHTGSNRVLSKVVAVSVAAAPCVRGTAMPGPADWSATGTARRARSFAGVAREVGPNRKKMRLALFETHAVQCLARLSRQPTNRFGVEPNQTIVAHHVVHVTNDKFALRSPVSPAG